MKQCKLLTFLIFNMLLMVGNLFARTSPSGQVSFVTPTALSSCNKDTICINVTNLKGGKNVSYTGNVSLQVNVPGGTAIQYLSNSVSSLPTGATFVSYTGKQLTMSVPLPALGATTKVCFVVTSDCSIATLSPLPYFTGTVTYPSGYPIVSESITSAAMNVGMPTLTVAGVSLNKTAVLGASNTSAISINNSGYGKIDNIKVTITRPSSFVLDSILVKNSGNTLVYQQLTPTTTTVVGANTVREYTLSGVALSPDNALISGETIRIYDSYTMPTGCATYNSQYQVEYLCAGGNTVCDKPITITDRTILGGGTPILTSTLGSAEYPDGCPNKSISYTVTNTGVGNAAPIGNAYDINLTVAFGNGILTMSNFKLNGVLVPTTNISPTNAAKSFTIKLKDLMTSDPDGAGGISDLDGDGYFDDMLVGASTTVSFNYTIPCDLACGANLYYQLSSNATFTDYCRVLTGTTNSPLVNFGFQQVQAITQNTAVNYGTFTSSTPPATRTVNFGFQYQAVNMNLATATAKLRITYSKNMEVTASSIKLNGLALTNTAVMEGVGATFGGVEGGADTDSAWVVTLTPAEVALLTDGTPDVLTYDQTRYSCSTSRQNTLISDYWQILFQTSAGPCSDNSTPCNFDLACRKAYVYTFNEGCGSVPCYIVDGSISRIEPLGYTNINLTTPINPADTVRSYTGDIVQVTGTAFINGSVNQEPIGYWANQPTTTTGLSGQYVNDLRHTMFLSYTKPKTWNKNTSIWKFISGSGNGGATAGSVTGGSKVIVYRRTPVSGSPNSKGTIGAVLFEAPILITDFFDIRDASNQTDYANFSQTIVPTNANYCGTIISAAFDICPIIGTRWRSNTNISQNRYVSSDSTKATDTYAISLAKALQRAGFVGQAGDPTLYFEVKTQWQMDDTFPWDNASSWSVRSWTQHTGNNMNVVGGTSTGPCGVAANSHLTVKKELAVANPKAMYSSTCGLTVCNVLNLNSFQGDYFRSGEVRVPYKLDSVVVDMPTEYSIVSGSIVNKVWQSCSEQTINTIVPSATTGHIRFTNSAGGDFPRADDCSGNQNVYQLCYTVSKTGTAAPNRYKVPVKYYTRDEFNNIIILNDTITISEASPDLTVTPLTSVLSNSDGGSCQPAFFDFRIQNNTLFDAPNVYFAAESSAGTTMLKITDHPDSTYFDPIATTDVSSYGTNNLYAKIGRVGAGDIRIVRVYASTTICADNFKVYTDFGCTYPASSQPLLSSTTLDQATVSYEAMAPKFLTSVTSSSLDITELCTNKTVELEVKNVNLPNLYKVLVAVKLPASVRYVASSGQIKYTVGSGTYTNIVNITSVSNDSVRFDLSGNSPFTTACGLTGSDTTSRSSLRIKFDISFAACPATVSEQIKFYTQAENYCGTKVISQNVLPINYIGTSGTQNNYQLNGATSSLLVCAAKNQSQTITDNIYIKNIGGYGVLSGASSGADSVTLTVPFDVNKLVLSNFTVGSPFSSPSFGTDVSGNLTIRVLIPAGLAVGDSLALPLTYTLEAKIDKLCQADASPLICYFGEFSTPLLLQCSSTSLNCNGLAKTLRGASYTFRSFDCCYGSIGDYTWFDSDKNGVQGSPSVEIPMANVNVYLYDTNNTLLDSASTNSSGLYLFDSLLAGNYVVRFAAPSGYKLTIAQMGTATNLDSDANITTGKTATITIDTSYATGDSRRDNRDVDAGFIVYCGLPNCLSISVKKN